MDDQDLSLDIISTLPQQIIGNIVTFMPIRDAVRTSILSSKLRYSWTSIPKLVFDKRRFKVKSKKRDLKEQKFADAIFHVLLLHKGPILEFNLDAGDIKMISKFDQIILHLSRRNDLKRLIISSTFYDLPTSFFSMQGLEELELTNCDFELPSTFNEFRSLRKLWFLDVEVPEKMFQRFLCNCPLLEEINLYGYENGFAKGNKFTFVELLRCVPLIKILNLSNCYMKYFATGGMPQKLPTSLIHLKYMFLELCLMEQDEISSALCMIRSSPTLEKITFQMYDNEKLHVRPTPINFFDPQDYSDMNLDHLEELEILMFSNLPLEWDFVKLIMAKSPVLKKTLIELSDDVSVDEELKMFIDLVELPFPRASTSAKLKIERPESYS